MSQLAIPARRSGLSLDADAAASVARALGQIEHGAEPALVVDAIDPRVRVLTVGGLGLVLFRVDAGSGVTWILHDVWPSSEASTWARVLRLEIPRRTSVPRVVDTGVVHLDARLTGIDSVELRALDIDVAAVARCLAEGRDPRDASAPIQASQADILRHLSAGESVDVIRERLCLTTMQSELSDNEAIRAGLLTPASLMNYALLDTADPSDAEWLLLNDFNHWRVFLHPMQRHLVDETYPGPALVSGGAGTGKTVVLLHRARALLRRYPSSRIVVSTFTRNLSRHLRQELEHLDPSLSFAEQFGDPGIYVASIDSIACSVLSQALRSGVNLPVLTEQVLGMDKIDPLHTTTERSWRKALASVPLHALPPDAAFDSFYEGEYAQVVLAQAIMDELSYCRRARRPTRGVRLNREQRRLVWKVIEEYRCLGGDEHGVDYDERAAIATNHLRATEPLADHLLIDEGQDLSAPQWQMARALIAPGPDDLFVAEDAHQRIFNMRIEPAHLQIDLRPTRSLDLTYRTTQRNISWATQVLETDDYRNLAGQPESHVYHATRLGEPPKMLGFSTYAQELEAIAEQIGSWIALGTPPEKIAVLTPTRHSAETLAEDLEMRAVPVRYVDRGSIEPGYPVVMTMHRAKGTEFAYVVMARVDTQFVNQSVDTEDLQDRRLRDRSVLYVAATRARDGLFITWSASPNPLLPSADWDSVGAPTALALQVTPLNWVLD